MARGVNEKNNPRRRVNRESWGARTGRTLGEYVGVRANASRRIVRGLGNVGAAIGGMAQDALTGED